MRTHCATTLLVPLRVAISMFLFAGATFSSGAQTANFAVPVSSSLGDDGSPAGPDRISIDFEVTDKLGHHLSGLQAHDFTLLDNKQPSNILDFREVDSRSPAADPVQLVVVIDTINTGFDVVASEREQLGQFLKQDGGRLAHPTSIALLTEKGIKIEKTSTTDGGALLASLDNYNSGLRMIGSSAGFYGAADRMQWSLYQLGEFAAYEATRPGRKLAVIISPGWPMFALASTYAGPKQETWIFNSIASLSNELREAHVTLYSLDPFNLGRTDPFYYQSYLKPVTKISQAGYPNLALQVLAEHSGGLALVSGNDIKGDMNTAVRDADAYYTLTFNAPPDAHANEYHDLHLQLDKPGITVRTTSGYYANTQR
jgi:VWFA-related protein